MRILNAIIIAFSTYSRLPMPQVAWTDENRRYSLCFFPLVGLAIGAVLALWLCVCKWLSIGPLLQGALGALIPLLISGGIHMDGFMDTTDALASWQPMEKKLEILKDSRVGAFAVMGCAGYLMLTCALLSEAAAKDAWALGCAFAASRAISAYLSVRLRPARRDGMLRDVSHNAPLRPVALAGSVYLALCLIVWLALSPLRALLMGAAAALTVLYYRRMAYRQFGGVTGDLAGWFSQMCELCLIAAWIIGGKLL